MPDETPPTVAPLASKKLTAGLQKWTLAVKNRDNHECQRCGDPNNLHAHHIKPRKQHPELTLDVDNGITLCAGCHADEHREVLPRQIISPNFKPLSPVEREERDALNPSAKEFRDWQARMGWQAGEAGRRLGKSADTISKYRANGVPPREAVVVLLACKALEAGIKP